MSEPADRSSDAEPDGAVFEAEQELAERLRQERPLPGQRFHRTLAEHLVALDPGYRPRPPGLRLRAAAALAAGLSLLALGALQATGHL
jgi:hypothetical protein